MVTTTDVYPPEAQSGRAGEDALAAKVLGLFADDHLSDIDAG